MLALIDGDILLYRVGFSTENESVGVANLRMSNYLDEITFNAQCGDYKIYLTDSEGNYRNSLYQDYKMNRVGMQKPKHYDALKEYLIKYEAAIISYGQEADDALGIEQTILGDESIICSIDKDLLMIPGWHYHLVKKKRQYITPEEGMRNFYLQLLTGDIVDNIPGLKGIGPKKANKILEGMTNEEQYKTAVYDAYVSKLNDLSPEAVRDRIQLIGQLLWIRRKADEMWSY